MMENNWKREEGAPAWNTWPTAHNFEGWQQRKQDVLDYYINLVIRFKRRERWEMLKTELGQEYLERVRESWPWDQKEFTHKSAKEKLKNYASTAYFPDVSN